MKKYLFISYSRENVEIAQEVIFQLEYNGYECWMDTERIQFGKWRNKTKQALSQAQACILILTPHSVYSSEVYKEIQHATKNKVPIFPLQKNLNDEQSELLQIIGDIQRIDIDNSGTYNWVNTLIAGLSSKDIPPSPADPKDERLLEARSLAEQRRYEAAITKLQTILKRRPSHLPAVIELMKICYNASRERIIDEENRGLRPYGETEMTEEFNYIEMLATHYIHIPFGPQVNEFRSIVWEILGMVSSFLGKYDDAFKRLNASIRCNSNNTNAKKSLKTLKKMVSTPHRRTPFNQEIPIEGKRNPDYSEPEEYSSWHSIPFPFSIMIENNKIICPSNVNNDWLHLWLIDHNISLAERRSRPTIRMYSGPKSWQKYFELDEHKNVKRLDDNMDDEEVIQLSLESFNKINDQDISHTASKRLLESIPHLLTDQKLQNKYSKLVKQKRNFINKSKISKNLVDLWG